MTFDGKAFGEQMVEIVKGYVSAQVEPLQARLDQLERHISEVEKSGARFRGVYQRASTYRRGEQATHKGSLWTALQDAPEGILPGESPTHWQLAAKGTG
ncbi:hypothetical protein [Parafrankia sp. BMG5.11]|uniref:hypothetical protein n=1 Tax=Parafrankia sp. BMG5.11 TaxID=222540 RepID=UPI00103B981F|nr:hypothetical protein [Parafrankia sp. BMG5.11]TCJ39208.1 hypothetical protein E0504_08645 [Parafrankia sp. BMG5.11]